MLFSRASQDQVLSQLRNCELEISALPNRTQDMQRAQTIIENLKAENATVDEIDAALASNGLPTVAEVGKATAESLFATWRLNRRRRKLEKQLAKF